MLYGLLFFFSLGLLLFSLLDCIATASSSCRNLPKSLWILLIVFLPTIGSVAWLLLGRPVKARLLSGDIRYRPDQAARPKRPLGPDDDPRFLEMTRRMVPPPPAAPAKQAPPAVPEKKPADPIQKGEHGVNELRAWERDLKRREDELRRRLEGETPED